MKLGKMMAGIGLLIGIYLFVSRPQATVSIISTLGGVANNSFKTLQGRG